MADLIVRNLEEEVVRRLKEKAVRDGISAEEAHRRLLRHALLEDSDWPRMSLKEFLLNMPDLGEAEWQALERRPGQQRPVDLE